MIGAFQYRMIFHFQKEPEKYLQERLTLLHSVAPLYTTLCNSLCNLSRLRIFSFLLVRGQYLNMGVPATHHLTEYDGTPVQVPLDTLKTSIFFWGKYTDKRHWKDGEFFFFLFKSKLV